MKTKGLIDKSVKEYPTRKERKILKSQGINMKDYKQVLEATKALREANKPAPVPPKPTTEQLLSEILVELKKGNEKELVESEKQKTENIK